MPSWPALGGARAGRGVPGQTVAKHSSGHTDGGTVTRGCRGTWVPGYVGARGTWVQGYVGAGVRGCRGMWVQGYVGARVLGCRGTWVPGTWVPGYAAVPTQWPATRSSGAQAGTTGGAVFFRNSVL